MENEVKLSSSEFLDFLSKNIIKYEEVINETSLFCAMNTARMFGKLEMLSKNCGFKGTLRINSLGAMFFSPTLWEIEETPNAIFYDLEYKDEIYTLKQKELKKLKTK
jgi:hypothetical protein